MTPPNSPAEGLRPSRRTALLLGVAATGMVAVSGCTVNNPLDDEKTPATRAVRDLAPDVAVAVEAATLLHGAQEAVRLTGERHPALAAQLAGLLATHRAHLDAVVRAVPDGVDTTTSGPAYAVPARAPRALAALVTKEHAVHDQLIGFAMRAESGAFARLLGEMAAAVSQRLGTVAT